MRRLVALLSLVPALACTGSRSGGSKDTSAPPADPVMVSAADAAARAPQEPLAAAPAAPKGDAPGAPSTSSTPAAPRARLVAWMRTVLPQGGRIVDEGDQPLRVVHTGTKGETPLSIARAYLDFTRIYASVDLEKELLATNKALRSGVVRNGTEVEIPSLVDTVPVTGDDARLPEPEDRAIRGIFLRRDGGKDFPVTLERLAARDMNAIVLDGKDYEGYVTYPTKVPLAVETKAAKNAPVRSLARAVQFAHAKGIRIIMRNSCFHDPWMAKQKPALSVQSKWGKPYALQWIDPANPDVQAYILEVIKEQLDAGVDEINLDYIRYPVQGIEGADFHLAERGLTQTIVIRDFVRKVRALTQPRKVPLSLDVFGVVAWNRPIDVEPLGQDLTVLGAECDALAPMVYPSHFAKGFNGFAEPGNHPEVIGIGTKATVEILAKANLKTAVRPWLQAFPWRSPDYGPKYIADEIRSAAAGGATGYLLWNPGGDYGVAWRAIPPKRASSEATAKR